MRARVAGVFAVALFALSLPAVAQASFPGENGKIAFARGGDIWTINPDGTGATNLTNSAATEVRPAWSPDGQKIVFNRCCTSSTEVVVMNADGSGQTPVTTGFDPSWSPDGTKIVYVAIGECGAGTGGVWTINPDGTGASFLACGPSGPGEDGEADPAWSPDGGLIAFTADLSDFDIFTVKPDGTNRLNITTSPNNIDRGANWRPDGAKIAWGQELASPNPDGVYTMNRDGSSKSQLILNAREPAWSPDGKKIAVAGFDGNLKVHNADGTSGVVLTTGEDPDWQPILRGYARPKAATPMYASLVPAYEECTTPNRAHAAPLSFNSCNPPTQTSHFATVGTPDANSQPAKSVGSLKLVAIGEVPINTGNGNQSDITIDFSLTDVRDKTTPANDYTGGLRAKASLQITDRNNTPYPGGPGPGTVVPITFEFNVPCTTTPSDATIGSTCAVSTTANTLVPGQVLERQRAIWQLGTVEVDDGGTDGNPSTAGDNTLFATQGVFIP